MIYTIPVVLLVFVLGRNLTLDDNTLLESQSKTNTYTTQKKSVPKETSTIKETKQKKDNLEQSIEVKKVPNKKNRTIHQISKFPKSPTHLQIY